MLSVLEKVGYKIDPDNTEDCSQMSKKNDDVLTKFSRQNKDCQHALWVKKYPRSLNRKYLGFHGEYKICTSRSLCQYYLMLWFES